LRRSPCPPPFPYTTLFRSELGVLLLGFAAGLDGGAGVVVEALFECAQALDDGLLRPQGVANDQALELLEALEDLFVGVGLGGGRSEEHTSELQSRENLVCR